MEYMGMEAKIQPQNIPRVKIKIKQNTQAVTHMSLVTLLSPKIVLLVWWCVHTEVALMEKRTSNEDTNNTNALFFNYQVLW